jgi:hypothetical protein
MLRKTIAALTIAFVLGGSSLPTSAFALVSAFGGDRVASGGNAYHKDRVSNLHRWLLASHGRTYQLDPWGHWGGYYGPMIGVQ